MTSRDQTIDSNLIGMLTKNEMYSFEQRAWPVLTANRCLDFVDIKK